MKIGFVSVIREAWGGSEELWAAAAHTLLNEKHSVVISAFNPKAVDVKMAALINKGAKLIYRRGYVTPGLPVSQRIPRKLGIIITNKVSNPYTDFFKQKPDLIVYTGASDSIKDDPYFLELAQKTKAPYIIIHQGYLEYTRTFDYHEAAILISALRAAKKNLFVADRNRAVMERFLATHIPNSEIIRNPVNLDSVEALPFPADNTVQFAMVANVLINHKGHDLVFEALSSEKWQSRSWHLNIYGSGIDLDFLKKLAGFFKLENRVTFHGKVTDIKSVWLKNHVLLMPSRFEGIPLAVVEAMLCARPVIATDVAGHREWIRDEIDGFIAEGANTLSVDNTMEKAWHKKAEWDQIGKNAHVQALKLFDPEPGKTLAGIIKNTASS